MLTVERHEGKPLIFESVKYRDGDKVSFAAWPRFAETSFELVTADGALTAPPMSDDERKVLMYLRDNGRSLLVDVCQNTRDVDAEVARQSYYWLEKKGLAYRVDEGTRTLHRWLADPSFRAALLEAEGGAIDAATRRLVSLTDAAIDTLTAVMNDLDAPRAVQLRAAQGVLDYLLKLRELRNVEERLSRLEGLLSAGNE